MLNPSRPSRSFAPFVVGGLVVIALPVAGYAWWAGGRVGAPPTLSVVPDKPGVGMETKVDVKVQEPVRGLVSLHVEASGAGLPSPVVLFDKSFATVSEFKPWLVPEATEHATSVVVGKQSMPALSEGTLTITATAGVAGTWRSHPDPVVVTTTLPVHLLPPSISPTSSFVHVAQGGVEAIVYDVGTSSVKDGVQVGARFFPGHPLPGAASPTQHFALFSIPYDVDGPEDKVKAETLLVAEDAFGNRAQTTFINKFIPRPMGKDTIQLTDKFMTKVTTEIYGNTPSFTASGQLLPDYLQLNRELRKQNVAFLSELSNKSKPAFLWRQTFQPFDNASVKGAFADRRTYVYNDAPVDQQDHLGFDLARVEHAPVPAGNDGVVVHAAYTGIFGNCVIVDHGYGLMTLYAHLSSIAVKPGDNVVRGQLVGNTGATGMAGGDHLHFTTLLMGLAVNPIEWWDAHWIQDRLKLKLGAALPFGEAGAGDAATTTTGDAAPSTGVQMVAPARAPHRAGKHKKKR